MSWPAFPFLERLQEPLLSVGSQWARAMLSPGTRRLTLVRAAGKACSQDQGLPCCGSTAEGGGCRVGRF